MLVFIKFFFDAPDPVPHQCFIYCAAPVLGEARLAARMAAASTAPAATERLLRSPPI
jgi:hypothetical protein